MNVHMLHMTFLCNTTFLLDCFVVTLGMSEGVKVQGLFNCNTYLLVFLFFCFMYIVSPKCQEAYLYINWQCNIIFNPEDILIFCMHTLFLLLQESNLIHKPDHCNNYISAVYHSCNIAATLSHSHINRLNCHCKISQCKLQSHGTL